MDTKLTNQTAQVLGIPLTQEDYDDTIKDLIRHGAFFGHRRRYWNPKMKQYAHSTMKGIDIIDLDKTMKMLTKTIELMIGLGSSNTSLMLVGCKPSASNTIKSLGEKYDLPYVNHRWIGGCLTNWKTVRLSIQTMKDMEFRIERERRAVEAIDESGTGTVAGKVEGSMTKKELLNFEEKHRKLYASLNGLRNLERPPELILAVDASREHIAISEARKMGKKIIALVDTNSDPDLVDYVLPINDDSIWVTEFVLSKLIQAYDLGRTSNK